MIGDRPVDLHLKVLGDRRQGGYDWGNMIITAEDGLVGDEVDLQGKHGPTVLGTDNLMMAAVLAKGTTIVSPLPVSLRLWTSPISSSRWEQN